MASEGIRYRMEMLGNGTEEEVRRGSSRGKKTGRACTYRRKRRYFNRQLKKMGVQYKNRKKQYNFYQKVKRAETEHNPKIVKIDKEPYR